MHYREKVKLPAGLLTTLILIHLLCSCGARGSRFRRTGEPSRKCGCTGSLHEFRVVNVDWSADRKFGDVQILADDSSLYEAVEPLSYGQVAQVVTWADQGRAFDTKQCELDKDWKLHPRKPKNSIRAIKAYYGCPDYSPAICKLEDGTIVKFQFSTLRQFDYISRCFVTHYDYDKSTGKLVPHARQPW